MKIKLNVKKWGYKYCVSKRGTLGCGLCPDMYEKIIGADVVGEVTFILRKIKSKVKDDMFRIRDYDLEVHNNGKWVYAKSLWHLNRAFNTDAVVEWAGKSKFTIESEK